MDKMQRCKGCRVYRMLGCEGCGDVKDAEV